MTDTDTISIRIENDDLDAVGVADSHDWYTQLQVDLDEDNNGASICVREVHSSNRSSTPMEVWHGRIMRWSSSFGSAGVVDKSQLDDLADKIRPLLDVIANNREVVWNGNNWVGKLTSPEAIEADEEIGTIVDEWQWAHDDWQVWDAHQWLQDWKANAHEYDIRTTMDAIAIDNLVKRIEADARSNSAHLQHTQDAVLWIMDKLADEQADNA